MYRPCAFCQCNRQSPPPCARTSASVRALTFMAPSTTKPTCFNRLDVLRCTVFPPSLYRNVMSSSQDPS